MSLCLAATRRGVRGGPALPFGSRLNEEAEKTVGHVFNVPFFRHVENVPHSFFRWL